MIAVIADDLTGAAEIAGLGWRHGLDAKILRRNQAPVAADLLVYDTDSRNCPPAEAARRVAVIARRLSRHAPRWIYKKVDSVLRGNVRVEIQALQKSLGLPQCLLVPANPSGGRIIRNGRYSIGGIPLHRTDFARDPRHPRGTDNVTELLAGGRGVPVAVCRPGSRVLPPGVVVGDAATLDDLRRWATRAGGQTLAAGGGEWFSALLARDGYRCRSLPAHAVKPPLGTTLFVSGSLAESSRRFVEESRSRHWPVFEMPNELFLGRGHDGPHRHLWARQASAALLRHPKVVMTVGRGVASRRGAARRLERLLAEAAREVLAETPLSQVCVEGGSTAAALLNALKWTRLNVLCEHARGVTKVLVEGPTHSTVVLKPGSYLWPASMTE